MSSPELTPSPGSGVTPATDELVISMHPVPGCVTVDTFAFGIEALGGATPPSGSDISSLAAPPTCPRLPLGGGPRTVFTGLGPAKVVPLVRLPWPVPAEQLFPLPSSQSRR